MSCDDNNAYKCIDCEDAWENYMEFGNYGTNEAYGISNINDVRVGDCIQARRNGERMWLKVTDVCDCFYLARVKFKLTQSHPFKKGALLRIEIQQVFNVERTAHWCIDYSKK
jgi:hypothetical protein